MTNPTQTKEEKCKETVNRFMNEIKTVTHAMIDGEHFSESPIKLVREAIDYLEERYEENKKENKKENSNTNAAPAE